MKRRHLFRTELKYDFGNRRFYISVLALCAVLLIVALPYRNHLIAFGGSTEGEAWLCTFTYAITSEKALLFFPLLVPLATAADIQEELHSRYAWFLINRIGKKKLYLDEKFWSCIHRWCHFRFSGRNCIGCFYSYL